MKQVRSWDLAQVNIARLIEPLDSDRLSDFVSAIDDVNAAADAAPGFLWRLKSEAGNAMSIRAFEWGISGSAGVVVNLSTWESPQALRDYVDSPMHRAVLRRRREWTHQVAEHTTVLWWVPCHHRPSTHEAEERLRRIRRDGSSAMAFALHEDFVPPSSAN